MIDYAICEEVDPEQVSQSLTSDWVIEKRRHHVLQFLLCCLVQWVCISGAVGGHKLLRNEGERSNSNLISYIIWYHCLENMSIYIG